MIPKTAKQKTRKRKRIEDSNIQNLFALFLSTHTPPEGGVRTKKCYITFDTIFGRYLPRGTLIDGSQKCRMGAFCTNAKYSGEMSKKGLKTGQNGVNFFSALTHVK